MAWTVGYKIVEQSGLLEFKLVSTHDTLAEARASISKLEAKYTDNHYYISTPDYRPEVRLQYMSRKMRDAYNALTTEWQSAADVMDNSEGWLAGSQQETWSRHPQPCCKRYLASLAATGTVEKRRAKEIPGVHRAGKAHGNCNYYRLWTNIRES